ncbi:MAG: hypothetical protein V4726_00105 [Verrucomicrobiota bacterium]
MPPDPPPVRTRLIAPLQSLGRIGKSTLAQALLSWADYAGVASAAIDADGEHRTLSGWYGDEIVALPFRQKEDLLPMLDAVGQAPLEIVDFPAQATDMILTAIREFGALQTLAERGVRLTVPIFASDERAGMLSAHRIITELGNEADYLIVTNPARFKSGVFTGSKIPELIPGAGHVHLGAVTAYTMGHLDAAGKTARRALTFEEALPLLNSASRHELRAWLNAVFSQFEDHASLLLPDPALIQHRVLRMPKPTLTVAVNPYDL